MIDLGLDRQGNREMLAGEISTPDDQVNPNSLSMALTGYRNSPRSLEILKRLYQYVVNQYQQRKDSAKFQSP